MKPFVVLCLLLGGATAATAGTLIACGGISDPDAHPAGETIASVSGALSSDVSVPDGAHVALVWRSGTTGHAVLGDTAIVDGRFKIDLTEPPSTYFHDATSADYSALSGTTDNGSTDDAPPVANGAGSGPIGTRDYAAGGITQPLNLAVAGFVVYVDRNGNGKLDIDGSAAVSSPDQILGGSDELIVADLRAGGQLEYEKLRDRSGILPRSGFNLSVSTGRWVPLDEVELTIPSATSLGGALPQLPSLVCGPQQEGVTVSDYDCNNPPPLPAPVLGVCTNGIGPTAYGCATDGGFAGPSTVGVYIDSGTDVVEGSVDSGVVYDSGS